MSVTNLIDIATADSYNGLEWEALSDAVKTEHIYKATVHMRTRWICVDVDWDDLTTLNDDLKKACAYYAEADRLGVLFTALAYSEPHRAKVKERKKLEGMEKEIEWSAIGAFTTGNPLASIDAIMSVYCVQGLGLIRT